MGLGHEVLAGNAVLRSGLDGEISIVGEPFWRSFDAHKLQQEVQKKVRFLLRSLQEKVVRKGQLMLLCANNLYQGGQAWQLTSFRLCLASEPRLIE